MNTPCRDGLKQGYIGMEDTLEINAGVQAVQVVRMRTDNKGRRDGCLYSSCYECADGLQVRVISVQVIEYALTGWCWSLANL